ncbi:MAG: type I polyketide synthase [Nostoc sp.]|uniref:type I polyketide synthase n=1 Tax=Nostoc sp. TaxID=1180 RepID=UPI002FF46409
MQDQKYAKARICSKGLVNADIAVIGIGCRFPGANNYQQFWQNIEQGINSITEIPSERWEVEKFYASNPQEQKSISKWGGFIEKIDQFDAEFFGISPREAQRMDPQQRLMLELTWSCIEDAGYAPSQLSGSSVGVFIGVCNYDYDILQNGYKRDTDGHTGTGTWACMIPNRISYFFNFHGPSIPVDTACSSSLVALHQAINALKQEECKTALVGGVSIFCTPTRYIQMSQLGMLSPQGQCRTFDNQADGYVRGEGAGVILLKPLAQAIEDKDQIYGVIKGSAVNHGGKARTLTSPNVYAQAQVLCAAYTKANIAPNTISYIEAHGTGTPLGDPIEINSLKRAFRKLHQQYHLSSVDHPYCGLGTVKTNIGHLEAAAGIAGVIKILLAMKNQKLPKIVNFQQLNPRIEFKGSPFYLVCETQRWKQLKTEEGELLPRRAGISSFGVGGVNTHVILEEAPIGIQNDAHRLANAALTKFKIQNEDTIERPYHLLTLSAKNEQALAELRHSYGEFLISNADISLRDICSTANIGREHFNHRLAIVADSREQLVEQLASFSRKTGYVGKTRPKIAFLFTGQGSQYINMGRQLCDRQPIFRQAIEQCDEILRPYLEHSLLEVLYPSQVEEQASSLLDQTAYTQPALFAIEYALYQLWKSWGIEPDIVMGHSVGEYVAATVAGVFSLSDGLKLIAQRGQLMQQLPSGGEMVSLMASEERVKEVVASDYERVSLAAINGSESVVISGARSDIAVACQQLEAEGIKTKHLQVSHAFHSPLMTPMLADFEAIANQVSYNQPQIPLVSNVTGQIAGENITNAQYWVNHVCQTVRFADSMQTLHQFGCEVFLEIGAKPILLGMGRQCLPESEDLWLPSLRVGIPEWQQLLSSLAELYIAGVNVDWSGFEGKYPHQKVALPTYTFQRQRHWIDTSEQKYQQAEPLSRDNVQNPITNFLDQGNTEKLVQLVQKAGKFSPEQIKLLPEILAVLAQEYKQYLIPDLVKDLCYETVWRNQGSIQQQLIGDYIPAPSEISHPAPLKPQAELESWLIFADNQGIGQQLSELLRSQQKACTLVFSGNEYKQISDREFTINPTLPEDFQRLLLFIQAGEQGSKSLPNPQLHGVVYLWSLDTVEAKFLTVTDLEVASQTGCGGVLSLIQSLINQGFSHPPSLWLITKGGQQVGVESTLGGIAQSPVWGLGKVITNEHPEFNCTLVDLDPVENHNAHSLFAEICSHKPTSSETHIAFRHGQRYVSRLSHSKKLVKQSLHIKTDATYLITGGLGEIGLLLAQWLVEHGAKHLVLAGRSSPNEVAKDTLRRLEESGSQVFIMQTDVSLEKDVTSLLTQIKTSMPPLKGIIHAAGVLEDRLLIEHQWQFFAKVFAPKVSGAWNLHTLTQDIPLDFFVLFSSVASILGPAGSANYAAANTFLDALAYYRRLLGLPGLTINWGLWSILGMAKAVGSRVETQWQNKGIKTIETQQALSILENFLSQEVAQVGVMQIDWSKFLQQYSGSSYPSFFSEIAPQLQTLPIAQEQQQVYLPQILDQIKASSQEQSQSLLISYLSQQIARALGTTTSVLNVMQPLNQMGLDSLMAVELRNRLRTELEINIPITKFLDGVSVVDLTKFVREQLFEMNAISKAPLATTITSNQNNWIEGEL